MHLFPPWHAHCRGRLHAGGGRSFGFPGSACTGSAVFLAGVVFPEPVGPGAGARFRHCPPVFLQRIAAGTGVFVGLRIEAEGRIREGVIGAVGLVEDRDMRGDLAVGEPPQHVAGSIGRVGCQTFRLQAKVPFVRSTIVFVAPTSAWRIDRLASTSTITALSVSIR